MTARHEGRDPNNSVKVLAERGDLLEQAIVRNAYNAISGIITPYSDIWFNHVFPRRVLGNGARVEENWMRFAGSHYTALIRVYHALRKIEELRRVCSEEAGNDGDQVLRIQDLCTSFWWNIGSAIDNFGNCPRDTPFEAYKNMGKEHFMSDERFKDLIYFYDRRTQFIHSRLVPIGIDGGMLVFHFEHLDSPDREVANIPKYTDWGKPFTKLELVEDFYSDKWQLFLLAMTKAWFSLGHMIMELDNDRPRPNSPIAPPDVSAVQYSNVGFLTPLPVGQITSTAISGAGPWDHTPAGRQVLFLDSPQRESKNKT